MKEFADLKMNIKEWRLIIHSHTKMKEMLIMSLICNYEWYQIRLISLDKGMSLYCYHLLLASVFA